MSEKSDVIVNELPKDYPVPNDRKWLKFRNEQGKRVWVKKIEIGIKGSPIRQTKFRIKEYN